MKQAHEVGVALHVDAEMEKLLFPPYEPEEKRSCMGHVPRSNKVLYQWQIKGDVISGGNIKGDFPDTDEIIIFLLSEKMTFVLFILMMRLHCQRE